MLVMYDEVLRLLLETLTMLNTYSLNGGTWGTSQAGEQCPITALSVTTLGTCMSSFGTDTRGKVNPMASSTSKHHESKDDLGKHSTQTLMCKATTLVINVGLAVKAITDPVPEVV